MSLCNCNKFEIDQNEMFSLLKEPKYKIFRVYKVIKHSKAYGPIQSNVSSGSSRPIFNNKLDISKEASIIYTSSKKSKNSKIKIKKTLNFEKIKLKKSFISTVENKKKCLTFKNINILVKPNFIDDVINNNKINRQENDRGI